MYLALTTHYNTFKQSTYKYIECEIKVLTSSPKITSESPRFGAFQHLSYLVVPSIVTQINNKHNFNKISDLPLKV